MNANVEPNGPGDQVRERPAWLIPAGVVSAIAVLSAAILLYYFAPSPDLLIAPTESSGRAERTFRTAVGDVRFSIRERYVRAIVEERDGKAASIDLHVAWPISLADPPEVDLDRPLLLDPAESIYLTITAASPEYDSAKRLQTLYPIYVDGPAADAGNGLVRLNMKPGSGYDDQEIFVGGEGERQFIARCFREREQEVLATCTRDRITGDGLAIRYRFNRKLLGDWQQLEAGVAAFLDHLRAP